MTTQTFEPQTPFIRRYWAQGRAEGEAKALLEVLDARGLKIPDDLRQRITDCTDLAQLTSWVRRAATADTIDAVFD